MIFKFIGKITAPMRNNGKTSAIDDEGYKSTLNMIFLLELSFWLLTTSAAFNLEGGLRKRSGSDERTMATMVDLGWQLVFMFGAKLA
jgi:hypothetical protein